MNRRVSWALLVILLMAVVPWCRTAEAKPNLGKKLMRSALQGETTKVQELLAQGADPNYADKDGDTPLLAAVGGCAGAVDVDAKGRITSTPTEGLGSVEMVRALLGAGARPNVANPRGVTALMYAAKYGRMESVRALLDVHADPNLKDADSCVALHWVARDSVAREGQPEIVSLLVQRGAILDARTVSGATPLGLAASADRLEMVRVLLGVGADPKASDKHGQTWIMSAAYGGHVEVMSVLVTAGADVMGRDEDGNTALSNAAYTGQVPAVAWLLDHRAEVNARANDGTTALSVAKKRGHLDVAALLEKRGGAE